MRVRNGQEFVGSRGEPAIACPAMTFRAVTVAAGAVYHNLVRAMIALLDAGAKRGGAACADVAEFLSVLAEDIGDFQSAFAHRWRAGSSESSMGCRGRASKGLATSCRRLVET